MNSLAAYALVAFVSVGAATAAAQTNAALTHRLDTIAGAGVLEKRSVGLVVALVKGQEPLLLQAYGKRDAEGNAAMNADTILPIASVTKQFTAAAILQLQDAGKLSVDDDVTKWLPDLETRGSKVTLRQILSHTAGIAELAELPEARAIQLLRNTTVTREDVYKMIRTQPLRFEPGTRQIYSNTGYWLLGRVVEKASGLAYEDYVEQKIFAPLGMSRSMYCTRAEKLAERAYGHGVRGGMVGRVPDIAYTATFSAGALCSTAGDMVTWLQALHGGKVLSPRSYADMTTPAKLNDGTVLRYAMGLTVWEDSRGVRTIGHDGGGFGYSSQAWWYADARLAVVLLTNSEPDDTTLVTARMLAEILPAPPAASPFPGDAALIAGTYKGPGRGNDMVVQVTVTPQGLAFAVEGGPAGGTLTWVETWTFHRDAARLTFGRSGTSGPATKLNLDTGGDHFVLQRQP